MIASDVAPRNAGVEDTRARILAAARDLYERAGSRGTTTRSVADLARVNEATLFRHFGTKQQLIAAMLEHFTEASTFGETIESVQRGATLERQLAMLGNAAIEAIRRKEKLIKVAMAEEITNPEGHNCAWRAPAAARRHLRGYFAARIAAGELRGDPDFLARTFLSLFFTFVMARAVWGDGEQAQERVVTRLVAIFLNGARAN